MDLQLKGKNAIVTGGAGGSGARYASCSRPRAPTLPCRTSTSRGPRLSPSAAGRRGRRPRRYGPISLRPEDCAALVDRVEELFGSADILVNNAGLWPTNLVKDIGLDEWRRTIDINLTAVFLASQRFVQLALGKGRKGKILNVTSQAAFNGSTTGHAHYAAAKSGVVTFTISLSREVAAKGINVNAIALGMVETPHVQGSDTRANREYYESRIQIGRIAQPIEVARLAVFLVSERGRLLYGRHVRRHGRHDRALEGRGSMKLVGIGDLFIPHGYIKKGFAEVEALGVKVSTFDWKLSGFQELQAINLKVEKGGAAAYEPPPEVYRGGSRTRIYSSPSSAPPQPASSPPPSGSRSSACCAPATRTSTSRRRPPAAYSCSTPRAGTPTRWPISLSA